MRVLQIGLAIGLLAVLGCHDNNGSNGMDMSVSGGDDLSGGGAGSCSAGGVSCAADAECCSNSCDPVTHLCAQPVCKMAGGSCANANDCCNLNCVNGTCGAEQCVSDGQACTAGGAACCSRCT